MNTASEESMFTARVHLDNLRTLWGIKHFPPFLLFAKLGKVFNNVIIEIIQIIEIIEIM